MKELIERLQAKPWVAHVLRAAQRYGARLGAQFSGAITYFSVLAVVPLLMLTFSIAGFIVTNLRPDLIAVIVDNLAAALGGVDVGTRESLLGIVENALGNYTAIGIFGLVSAAYSGAGWMGNLKSAVRAQSRPVFDFAEAKPNIVVNTLINLALLLGLIVALAITFCLAVASTTLTDTVVGWLGFAQVGLLAWVFRLVPVLCSIAAGWLLFSYLYTVLPEQRPAWRVMWRGALLGAIGLVVLQDLTSILIGAFSGNPAAALFGPVIVIMLFFNLFAQLILFVAAWIATDDQPAIPESPVEERVRFALAPQTEQSREPAMVSQEVAVRNGRAALGAGYLTGTATGVGLGALIALAAARLTRRHPAG